MRGHTYGKTNVAPRTATKDVVSTPTTPATEINRAPRINQSNRL
ncbi:MAG: hypothetical protein R2772_02155 [Chitinophagales bacterium]